MRNISYLIIILFLASCTTQRYATTPNVTLNRLSSDTGKNDQYLVKVNFTGLMDQNYQFNVSIRNNSKSSVSVTPSLFAYNAMPKESSTTPHLIYSLNPKEEINKLKIS